MPLSKVVTQPMLRQAQQACSCLREGFQTLNLMVLESECND